MGAPQKQKSYFAAALFYLTGNSHQIKSTLRRSALRRSGNLLEMQQFVYMRFIVSMF